MNGSPARWKVISRSGIACFVVLITACGFAGRPEALASAAGGIPAAPATQARPTPTVMPTAVATPTATLLASTTPAPPTGTIEPAPPSPTPTAAQPPPVRPVYVFPVQSAGVRYVDYHHDYPAADIECAIGSRFVAVTSGTVDYMNAIDMWLPATDGPADRSGLAVAIVGDDGVRYYGSHLSEIAAGIVPGAQVEAGQVLGLTGISGNANRPGIAPHLHFGISRPTTPDDWQTRRGTIRPYAYLQAWERGQNSAPVLP